jgi:hypothetical protein
MRFEHKAGMLLKRKDVAGRQYVVGGREQVPGVRSQKIGSMQKAGKAGIDGGNWQTSLGPVF